RLEARASFGRRPPRYQARSSTRASRAFSFSIVASSGLVRATASGQRRRWDVLVQPEQVLRVVAALHLGQPPPCRAGIRGLDALLSFLAEEVDVRAVLTLTQRGGGLLRPRAVSEILLRRCVDGSDVDHQPALPVRERRLLGRDAGDCAAEHP